MAEQARGVGRIGTHRCLERTDRVVTKGPPSAANARGGCARDGHGEARRSGTSRASRARLAATSPWPSWSRGVQGPPSRRRARPPPRRDLQVVLPPPASRVLLRRWRECGAVDDFGADPQIDPWRPEETAASERHPRRRFWGMFQGNARRSDASRANGAMVGSIFGGRVESGGGCPRCSRRAAPPTTQTRRGHQGAAQAEAVVATFGPGGAVEPDGWVRPRLLRQPDPEVFRSCG